MKTKKRLVNLFLFLVFFCFIILIKLNNDDSDSLKKLNYSNETIAIFKEKDIYNTILKLNKYSKTLEVSLIDGNYISKYLNDYLDIEYVSNDDFILDINALLDLGYSSSEINTLFKHLSDDSIKLILKDDYNKELSDFLKLPYFKEDNLIRYIDYKKKYNDLTSENVVTYVNANLDYDFYTNVSKIDNGNDLFVLVNKYNYLDKSFIPHDLELVSSNYSTRQLYLKKIAIKPFEEMCADAMTLGITIKASSTYRDYDYQYRLYNYYIKRDGVKKADTYSARPGYSEHQTGLAIDISNGNELIKENSDEYNYIINNSYKYGFVVRYMKGKEHITGFMFEPWHVRYFGVELATYLYNNNLTYEEYIGKKN